MMIFAALALTACDYTEVKREIGYKGKARINPWLAAERFAARYDHHVRSLPSWTAPDIDDVVWFVPASVLGNRSFIRRMDDWVRNGGHLVLLVEHADSETNDWSKNSVTPVLEPELLTMLARSGIQWMEAGEDDPPMTAGRIKYRGRFYEVDASSESRVVARNGKPGVLASVTAGDGRLTVVTDARIFRNRWIGDKEHAALLGDLIDTTEYEGHIGFLRGSGISLWGLLGKHVWPVLVGLGALTLVWLWKNLTRFGPVESADGVSVMRGYEHHLQALGDFQWRLDRAAALLAPLRAQIVERGQRIRVRAGRRDEDFLQFLADRAALPRERVSRALSEDAPPDSSTLTRTTADLQKLLQVLH